MTLEEIKEGLQTAGEQELLSVDEIITIVINQMQDCRNSAIKIALERCFSLEYKITYIQSKESQMYSYSDFLKKLGVNEMYLAILKDDMSLCCVISQLQVTHRLKEQEGKINAYSNQN